MKTRQELLLAGGRVATTTAAVQLGELIDRPERGRQRFSCGSPSPAMTITSGTGHSRQALMEFGGQPGRNPRPDAEPTRIDGIVAADDHGASDGRDDRLARHSPAALRDAIVAIFRRHAPESISHSALPNNRPPAAANNRCQL
uniref:Uncharacterized protein n=1 Tax=Plectus sambesii TaxID=2011161 RepID=A0A914WUU8_9BILA